MVQILFFRLDLFSFWLGFLFGLIFFWLSILAYRNLPGWWKNLNIQIQALRDSLNAGIENRLRNDIIHWTQRQHLAAALFSLDEILIQPRLMTLPLSAHSNSEYALEEITNLTLPYLPDWPEAAGAFGAPSLSLAEAAQEGASLIVMGHPGAGKTVALAHLAGQMARQDPETGAMSERFPIIVHAADLLPKLEDKSPLAAVFSAVTHAYASKVILPQLNKLLNTLFENGRALFILDGLDEFDRLTFDRFYQYLERLHTAYPRLQMVVSTSPEYYGHLNKLGFLPMALAAWGDLQRSQFLDLWAEKWSRHIQDLLPPESKVDPLLLKNWIQTNDPAVTPLELTLKAWAAFAGDMIRPDLTALIEAYLRRITLNLPNIRPVLGKLAAHIVLNQVGVISSRETDTLFNVSRSAKETSPEPGQASENNEGQPSSASTANDPNALVNAGLLVAHNGSNYRMLHPILTGYLAGNQFSTSGQAGSVAEQPTWVGKTLSLGFMGQWMDISGIVNTLLSESKDLPIPRSLFVAARWLRGAPRNAAWRGAIMRELANTIQKEYHTPGFGARAVVALALSGDPSVTNLFRQLARSDFSALRQLGVIGMGLCPDAKTINDLAAMTQDSSPNVSRATCLSLIRLGTRQAHDMVISILLHGSEEMRRAAAEALTNLGEEGFSILKEALESEDLLVRRASIFGLLRLNRAEVIPLLEKAAVQDAQWVVRNAAAQALEQKKQPNPYLPKRLPSLPDTGWLLTYAGKSGIGIANETQGMEMLLNAVDHGEVEERMLALEMLSVIGDQQSVAPLYHTYYSSKDEVREAAFNCIWHIMSSGASLPPPAQFGLG